jgi:hypothetical protein
VTLEDGAITLLVVSGIVAVAPEKLPDPAGFPLPVTFTPVMEPVLPVLFKVKFVIVAGEPLGLVRITCWTGTPEVPGNWLELEGWVPPDTVTTT